MIADLGCPHSKSFFEEGRRSTKAAERDGVNELVFLHPSDAVRLCTARALRVCSFDDTTARLVSKRLVDERAHARRRDFESARPVLDELIGVVDRGPTRHSRRARVHLDEPPLLPSFVRDAGSTRSCKHRENSDPTARRGCHRVLLIDLSGGFKGKLERPVMVAAGGLASFTAAVNSKPHARETIEFRLGVFTYKLGQR
ncbi:MAG: hypothetical protein JNK05_39980 [Myxococcales bacterium]|nr:hypothetical protein [Myxococcales bacterium]